ncbi:putative lipoprotein [Chlamydia pneumoniae LPCoLN]|uniref:hypothetical protein n=1 Tax=Chlamydia pneumoniae TaxID=83558 RepID=UPI0001BD9E35|nr:hypothetical protein [Chlamydia pneumoniae]ACZ33534.1 putative lipoprotein [Chlamydia pneumoniae LPCoLN]ETR80450.1 hypothetical protein X556_0212 [Chlamydia pneumoniae B21]
MKLFYFCNIIFLTSLFSVSCTHTPPPRSYILAQGRTPLVNKAHSLEFFLARAVFNTCYNTNL